jgi:hypothetical protein
MTKQEYLCMSLPYNIKVQLNRMGVFNLDEEYPSSHNEICSIENIIVSNSGFEFEIGDGYTGYGYIEQDEFDMILRPLTELMKPISQKDYKDGQEFIPLIELAKIANINQEFDVIKGNECGFYCQNKNERFHYNFKNYFVRINFTTSEFDVVENQLELFQHLIKWHFAVGLEEGDFIVVTEEFDPYK